MPAGQRTPSLSASGAPRPAPDTASTLQVLSSGTLSVVGRLVVASNATLLATVALDGAELPCVYKPVAGERPLRDFPSGTLALRETATYVASRALGGDLVPPTVLRDGPFGPGSVQEWVGPAGRDGVPAPAEPGAGLIDVFSPSEVPSGWLVVLTAEDAEGRPVVLAHADDPVLRRMAVLDAVVNNADRKGGHVLRDPAGRLNGVDHGLTFHMDAKLRTVLWGWAGHPLPEELRRDLRRLLTDLTGDGAPRRELAALVTPEEVEATRARVAALLDTGRYPTPRPGHPPVPWPVF